MPEISTSNQGKTLFVKETLSKNPQATTALVNKAWVDAGRDGQISETLVTKVRSRMGLTGNLRAKGRKQNAPAAPGPKPERASRQGKNGQASPARRTEQPAEAQLPKISRAGQFADLEADLDRLLFQVMSLGNLPKVEEAIRATRRALYRAFTTE